MISKRLPQPYVAPKPACRAFIDFEFNGKGGRVLSAAIVTESGAEWYEVMDYADIDVVPWVAENCLPNLGKEPISAAAFQASFEEFINQFGYIEFMYNAHADRRYLDELLLNMPQQPLHRCVRDGFLSARSSLIPHNALADARAIVAQVCGSAEFRDELPVGPTERDMFKAMWAKGYRFDARDVRLTLTKVEQHDGKPYGHRAQLEIAAFEQGLSIMDLIHRDPTAVFCTGVVEITPIHNRSNASAIPMHGVTTLPIYFYIRKD